MIKFRFSSHFVLPNLSKTLLERNILTVTLKTFSYKLKFISLFLIPSQIFTFINYTRISTASSSSPSRIYRASMVIAWSTSWSYSFLSPRCPILTRNSWFTIRAISSRNSGYSFSTFGAGFTWRPSRSFFTSWSL